jgi:hypothetical protein
MAALPINEQAILEELHQVPQERWGEVLTFLRALQQGRPAPTVKRPIVAGADLRDSDLIGMWADRTDISDSREFAQQLRDRAEHRRRTRDVSGH